MPSSYSSKTVKLIGLFKRNPWDICFLLLSILFGYVHSFIKGWAFVTLHQV
ncbi:hypothetical protein NA56DRAFT_577033 [Hyaloscypha hepaticicola]|uniref:Uncharacterized protein n=1 Tax=Hyaloscypha hepaticicola TaxID=2082293 RepID=A0A2J6PWV2_9HELO|nr:hypothetical protein NA56DRAFT_577033 [Hyaloscypha hepaticicola]